jgi:hypothetical protein
MCDIDDKWYVYSCSSGLLPSPVFFIVTGFNRSKFKVQYAMEVAFGIQIPGVLLSWQMHNMVWPFSVLPFVSCKLPGDLRCVNMVRHTERPLVYVISTATSYVSSSIKLNALALVDVLSILLIYKKATTFSSGTDIPQMRITNFVVAPSGEGYWNQWTQFYPVQVSGIQ